MGRPGLCPCCPAGPADCSSRSEATTPSLTRSPPVCAPPAWSRLDAHHDLRDGMSNGSPVQRLLADGFDGSRIVQIGIGDFTNSRDYARRAQEYGVTIIDRDQVEDLGPTPSWQTRSRSRRVPTEVRSTSISMSTCVTVAWPCVPGVDPGRPQRAPVAAHALQAGPRV